MSSHLSRWVETGGTECGDCAELDHWESVGRPMGKARFGGMIGPNPTDCGKAGTSRPLPIVVAGAVHDAKLLEATLDAIGWNDHSPLNPNTCVWTKGMTILQAVALPPDTAIGSTSGGEEKLDASGDKRPAGGLWNGSPSAVRRPIRQEGGNYLGVFIAQWRRHFEISPLNVPKHRTRLNVPHIRRSYPIQGPPGPLGGRP